MKDIAEQAEYYSTRWASFEYANRIQMALLGNIMDLVSGAELPRGCDICDLGCGAGWSTNVLNAFGRTTGVDLSDLSDATARYPRCHFETANVLEWEPQQQFDLVVSMEVLEHIELESRGQFMNVIKHALKPSGLLALSTPNARTMNAIAGGGRTYSNQPIENWLTARELRNLLRGSGFEILAKRSVWLGVGSRGLYRIVNAPKVNRLAGALGLGRAFGRFATATGFGLHMVVLARKFS